MRTRSLAVALTALAATAAAQLPAPRRLTPAEAMSTDRYSTLVEVRPLSDGRALVNDPNQRRLLLVDDKLAVVRVLFDSTTPAPLAYPHGTARLVVARGDSTWLGEPDARGFRVLDSEGRAVRRQALFDLADMSALTGHFAGTAIDAHGDIVFAEPIRPGPRVLGETTAPNRSTLIRLHHDRPGRDTIGTMSGGGVLTITTVSLGSASSSPRPGTLPQSLPGPVVSAVQAGDAWAVLPSGLIAIVRGSDYHVDWMGATGQWTATPRIPWPWEIPTPEAKRQLVDSVQRYFSRGDSAGRTATLRTPDGAVHTLPIAPTLVSPDIPDTLPAIAAMSARVDPRGRIWVREGMGLPGPIAGPAIYDVIDGRGQMVDRFQLEAGETVAAVGPNDTVYLEKLDGKRLQLLRCHIPRR